jgi:hypothetical protein
MVAMDTTAVLERPAPSIATHIMIGLQPGISFVHSNQTLVSLAMLAQMYAGSAMNVESPAILYGVLSIKTISRLVEPTQLG